MLTMLWIRLFLMVLFSLNGVIFIHKTESCPAGVSVTSPYLYFELFKLSLNDHSYFNGNLKVCLCKKVK